MKQQTIHHLSSSSMRFSMREQLIIAQALAIGIQELKKVPAPMTELSNILDMEEIAKHYFGDFFGVAQLILSETNNIHKQLENQLKD